MNRFAAWTLLVVTSCSVLSPKGTSDPAPYAPGEDGSDMCGSEALDSLGTDGDVLVEASEDVTLSQTELRTLAMFWVLLTMAQEGTLTADQARVFHEEALPGVIEIAYRYPDLFRPCDDAGSPKATASPKGTSTTEPDCGCDLEGRPGAGCSDVVVQAGLDGTISILLDRIEGTGAVGTAVAAVKAAGDTGMIGLDLVDYAAGLDDDTVLDIVKTVGSAVGTVGAVALAAGATSTLVVAAAAVGTGVTVFESGMALLEAALASESCSAFAEAYDCDGDGAAWRAGDCLTATPRSSP